jgi:hypothetical protein
MTTQHPIIISYYTPNSPYEVHAAALKKSVDALGLACLTEPRNSKGSWTANCAQKALFIRDCLHKLKAPVLWVDADARLLKPLTPVVGATADFAIVRRDGWSFYSGQAFFNYTPQSLRFIDHWCSYCTDFPHVWDQVSLGYAWWDQTLKGELTTTWLPESVFAKESRFAPLRPLQKIFISASVLHKQESRRSADKISERRDLEFSNKMLPDWWRDAMMKLEPFALSSEQRKELGLIRHNPA